MRIMEPKKNPAIDVHRYRSTLFSIGLITSIVLVTMAFQWKTQVTKTDVRSYDTSPLDIIYEPPITDHLYAEKKVNRVSIPINFVAVDNIETIEPTDDIVIEEPFIDQSVLVVNPMVEVPTEIVKDDFVVIAEVMPLPENGYEGFYDLLRREMQYPRKAQSMDIQGKVFVEFIVNENGSLSQLKVVKGIGGGCDEEAVRVLSLSKWSPGKQRGKPVKVKMVQPIVFKLKH